MSKELELMPKNTAIQKPVEGISIEQAFQAAATKALDKDSLEVMKQLLAMDAEGKFNRAFVAMQSELPVIVATSIIPNRGKYERFEDILHKVAPIMAKHGFSVAFSQVNSDGIITVVCRLMHAGGHSHSNSFAVRAGMKGDNEAQADCKSSTIAKRNAFCQALNIVIAQDAYQDEENDPSLIGNPSEFVTPEQADELERRVNETNSDPVKFLRFCDAPSFAKIPANKYAAADAQLHRKEIEGK